MFGRLSHGFHPRLWLAGRDFARLARPTILAYLAPQRDDVDVARRGRRVEVDERAAHEVGARARNEFAVRRLDHRRRRGINDARGDEPNGNALQQTLRDEAVAQSVGRRRPSADPPRRRLSRTGAGAWFSSTRAPRRCSRSSGSWSARPRWTGFSAPSVASPDRQGSARARAQCASCRRPSGRLAHDGAGRRDDRLRDRRPRAAAPRTSRTPVVATVSM